MAEKPPAKNDRFTDSTLPGSTPSPSETKQSAMYGNEHLESLDKTPDKGRGSKKRRRGATRSHPLKKQDEQPTNDETTTSPGAANLEPVNRRDARRLLKHGRKLLKRHKGKLSARQAAQVDRGLSELYEALIGTDLENLTESYHRADRRLERHLGFAQKGVFREYAESIIFAVLLALLLRAFVVEAFKIPTKSMVPTLLEGDHLFVNKFSYGIRIPFTTSHLITFDGPDRGDVVVFIFPREQASEHISRHGRDCIDRASLREEKDYIKRVVGLPGDTIEVLNNVIHINGEPIPRKILYKREVPNRTFPPHRFTEVWAEETLGEEHYVTASHESSLAGTFAPTKVKDGHIFVMGDNRDNSSDSRCWGQVPIENVKGEALVIWWSSGPHGARWSRMFSPVH